MNELIEKVEQWAIDRNLHTADSKGQALKVVEEFTETLLADQKGNIDEVIDGIGDTYVTLIILCKQIDINFMKEFNETPRFLEYEVIFNESINQLASGIAKGNKQLANMGVTKTLIALEALTENYEVTPEQCLSVAYNEIKDRRGKMIDGVFVKESDLHGDDS